MSDYMPDTDRVSAAATEPGAQITPAEFDRWLESVRAEERERIARNIEGQRIAPYQGSLLGEDDRGWNRAVEQAARIAREGA